MNIDALKSNLRPLDISQPAFCSAAEQEYFRYYNIDFEDRNAGVEHFFGSLASGDYQLACHYFRCASARGSCFILHGYYDHAGLFSHIIDFCLQRQLSVVIFDLPGHGLSSGEQASIKDFADYQAALNSVLDYFAQDLPAPHYAIAQSTGGAILMEYLLANPQPVFAKTVLLAPLVRPMGWALISTASELLRPVKQRIRRRPSNSTTDAAFRQFVNSHDPLQSKTVSITWLLALKQWIKRFLLSATSGHAPLVVQGEHDSTVDWIYNINVIKRKFPHCKIAYLASARHHLANESEEIRKEIFQQMDQYLES